MKLDLAEINGVYILSIEGELNSHNVKVLSAGVQKLLKDGKKQLILNLEKTSEIDASIPVELIKAKQTSEQLGGTLMLAVKSDEIIQLMEKKAGSGWCFASQAEALAAFKNKPAAQPDTDDEFEEADDENDDDSPSSDSESETQPSSNPGEIDLPEGSESSRAVKERDALIEELRAKIQHIEAKQLHQLRSENEKLKEHNQMLQDKLLSEIKEDQEPPDVTAYQDKIRLLETRLNETLQKVRALEKET